jgi:GT2 family glycosyltransferase
MTEPTVLDQLVSVVVPAHQNPNELRRLLAALETQTLSLDRFEVVVGDDGSQPPLDVTGTSVLPRMRWGPKHNSYAARNRAAAAAHGEVLAFVDSDCAPDPEWLERGVYALQDAEIAAGQILLDVPVRPTPVWSILDIELFCNQQRTVRAGSAVTGNLFIRRRDFEALGGFDMTLPSGGDVDFTSRATARGLRLVYAGDAVVRHPARTTAKGFFKKLWRVNRSHGARLCRAGISPPGASVRGWIPVVRPVVNRRRSGIGLGLQSRRLEEMQARPSLAGAAAALGCLYLVIPYVANVAQLRGAGRIRPRW